MQFNFLKEYESNWLAWRGRNLLFAQVAPISDFNFYLLFGQHFLEKKIIYIVVYFGKWQYFLFENYAPDVDNLMR